MRVAILGAGGIIGQTMRLYEPSGVLARYYRKSYSELLFYQLDLLGDWVHELNEWKPEVVLNLAGENRPDVVEKDLKATWELNVDIPHRLALWCQENGSHYVHVSTQAVFSGENPPYSPDSLLDPINLYGVQKAAAERVVRQFDDWTIIRPTFVIGLRPFPMIGRQNPLEQMLENPDGVQVNDRWFSVLFARSAAIQIWEIILRRTPQKIWHLGSSYKTSRYDIAKAAGLNVKPVSHDYFPGLAPRPKNTRYRDTIADTDLKTGLFECGCDKYIRERDGLFQRSLELSLFFGIDESKVHEKLTRGFSVLHEEVAEDFRSLDISNDSELLEWYRTTLAYIWELTAYHLDDGFNYTGMCRGIADRIRDDNRSDPEVLVLADGIGDLTLYLREKGIDAYYHDLSESMTATFALFRFWRRLGEMGCGVLSETWQPPDIGSRQFDYVICLDFLEHVTDVPKWTQFIYSALKPNGVALFQNAFGLGSEGSIPMHLKRNAKYEKEWTPLLDSLGFEQIGTSNWWRRVPVAL